MQDMVSKEIRNNIINDLKELNDCGNYKYSQTELAIKYGVSCSYISKVAKKEGLSRYKRMSKNVISDIINKLNELDENKRYKYSVRQLSKMYNVTQRNIYHIIKKNKIYDRRYGSLAKYIIDNIIEDLKALNETGNYKFSQTKIAKKYDVSDRCISNIAKKHGLNRNKISPLLVNNVIRDLQELDEYGNFKFRYKDISKKYSISNSSISIIMRQNNLARNNK